MRLISIDIDPHNRSNRIHLGPFVSGLNAVWGARGSGKSTVVKFIRGLLYHRHRDASGYGQEAVEGLVGSLQWADEEGKTRVVSSADAVQNRDYCFSAPYYFGRRRSEMADAVYPHATVTDQPWHRIGGEIYDAVFCGRLGETLPERLWQAARELGIHVAINDEQDETYRRLKSEEARLQQRLHHLRVDDRDRTWWAAERERLACRIQEVSSTPDIFRLPIGASQPATSVTTDRQAATTNDFREWESLLIQHQAERSELLRREAELSRQLASLRGGIDHFDRKSPTDGDAPSHGRYPRSSSLHRDYYGTWSGYVKSPRQVRDYGWSDTANKTNPTERLEADYVSIQNRIAQLTRHIEDLEVKLRRRRANLSDRATSAWEAEELRVRLLYAEEVLKSWDLYETTRRRLSEVQNQLQGHGPYHEAIRGSFLTSVERYVRELSAGSLRRLPTWALEALRRDLGFAAGLSNQGKLESYREVYRDYRADTRNVDFPVPPSQSSERQLVELAIRMAIAEAASSRIGRLPLILDDALDGFHGQTLDHVVRVLIEFACQGQQVLLMTSEREVAERVRVHHGWVAYIQPTSDEGDARASVAERHREPPMYAIPAKSYDWSPSYAEALPSLAELNAQLSAAADSHPFDVAHRPTAPALKPRYERSEHSALDSASVPTSTRGRFFLSERCRIEDAPGMQSSFGQTIKALGIETVGQWITTNPHWVAEKVGAISASLETIVARQSEARLMCGVPQLRAFDARVLAGCGIQTPQALAQMHPGSLLETVEAFLATPAGQEILRSGTSYELSRITSWIASARRSLYREVHPRNLRGVESIRQRRRKDRLRRDRDHAMEHRSSLDSDVAKVQRHSANAPTKSSTSGGGKIHQFYLDLDSPVVDAPSIGPRMADRLATLGIQSVRDLLNAIPAAVVHQLNDGRITANLLGDWQNQARLVCAIPNLRGHDAQILVACGVKNAEQLMASNDKKLHAAAMAFVSTKAGQRALRGAARPDLNEVRQWIASAKNSRVVRAA